MVVESLKAQLAEWEKQLPGVSMSALAAVALNLAAHLDDPGTKATAASNTANSLDRVLERIEASLPPLLEDDEIDELRLKRELRRAG